MGWWIIYEKSAGYSGAEECNIKRHDQAKEGVMRSKSAEKAKAYRRKLKAEVISQLGGRCAMCGAVEELQLHHARYAPDSIRHDDSRMESRYREARDHPERFTLLCRLHHPWGANIRPPSLPITRWRDLWKEDKLWRFVQRR